MFNIKSIKQGALVILSITGLVVAGNAFAKGHGAPNERGFEMQKQIRSIMAKLDLSDDQKAQMKLIREQRKTQLMELKVDGVKGSGRAEMQALLMADNFDESKFIALQQKHQDKKQKAALISARNMHQIIQVLTPEQKQKFMELQQQRQDKRKKQQASKAKGKNNKNND